MFNVNNYFNPPCLFPLARAAINFLGKVEKWKNLTSHNLFQIEKQQKI